MECVLDGCTSSKSALRHLLAHLDSNVIDFRIQSNPLMSYATYGNENSLVVRFVRVASSDSPMNRLDFRLEGSLRDITNEPGVC